MGRAHEALKAKVFQDLLGPSYRTVIDTAETRPGYFEPFIQRTAAIQPQAPQVTAAQGPQQTGVTLAPEPINVVRLEIYSEGTWRKGPVYKNTKAVLKDLIASGDIRELKPEFVEKTIKETYEPMGRITFPTAHERNGAAEYLKEDLGLGKGDFRISSRDDVFTLEAKDMYLETVDLKGEDGNSIYQRARGEAATIETPKRVKAYPFIAATERGRDALRAYYSVMPQESGSLHGDAGMMYERALEVPNGEAEEQPAETEQAPEQPQAEQKPEVTLPEHGFMIEEEEGDFYTLFQERMRAIGTRNGTGSVEGETEAEDSETTLEIQ